MADTITIARAAELIGVSESRISQLVSAGVLAASWSGGRRLIDRASAEAYRDSNRTPGRRPSAALPTSLRYTLMCAEYEVARISYNSASDYPLSVVEVLSRERMPLGTLFGAASVRRREFNEWWEHRSIPNTRPGLERVLPQLNVSNAWQIPFKNYGLSLSDCYWVVPDGVDAPRWSEVNYFDNDFVGSGDAEWDGWLENVGLDSPDNTSEGELPKRWVIRDNRRVLLKGGGLDDQRPFNEVVATALHARLLQPGEYVPYALVRVAGGPACACPNFLSSREEYIPAALVKRASTGRGASVYERFCRGAANLGANDLLVRDALSKLIACDAIIANTDRHWRNFGFIRNVDTLELRPAPLFDSGNSLWYAKTPADVARLDWSFAARPFGPNLVDQLALVDSASWFDPVRLEGFADEAVEVLRGSAHASAPGRLDYIARGLEAQIRDVTLAMGILAARIR